MPGILSKLKRTFVEPNVYAVLAQSRKGAVLHLGVHYTLEEAIEAAKPALRSTANYRDGDHVDVDLYTILNGTDVVKALLSQDAIRQETITITNTSIQEAPAQQGGTPFTKIEAIKDAKNALMKELIDRGDPAAVEASKGVLNTREYRLVSSKVKAKIC